MPYLVNHGSEIRVESLVGFGKATETPMFDSILCIAHSLLEHEVTWRFFQFPIHLLERPFLHSGFED